MARRRLVHPSRQAELEHRARELVRSAYRQMRGSVARRMGERGVGLTAAAGEVGAVWSQAEWTSILSDDVMPGMSAVVEDAWNAVEASLPKGATWGMKDVQQQYLNQLAENLIAMGGTVGARVEDYAAVLAQAYASAARDEAAGAAYKAALAGLDDSLDGGEAIFDNYAGTSVSQMVNGMGQEATGYLDNVNPTDYPDARAIWNAVGDERTREWHDEADGQEQPLGEPFIVDDEELYYPGDPNGSDENIINCFPGDTLVEAPTIERSYRRWYSGPVVTVETAGGNELTGTPNHPVLTLGGWVALHQLVEGDHLVCGVLREWVSPGDPDVAERPPRIADLHGALSESGDSKRHVGRLEQFHGDGRNGDVDVVAADGRLGLGPHPALSEPVRQSTLTASDLPGRGPHRRGAGSGPPGDALVRVAATAAGFPGSSDQQRSALGSLSLHPQAIRLAAPSRLDSRTDQAAADRRPRDAEAVRQSVLALARDVSLDEVRRVEVRAWAGHVYNLQTADGWYLANSVVGGNCRCWLEYEGIDQAVAEGVQEES